MKKKYKKKISNFFKEPLVLLFLMLVAWALFMRLSTSFIVSRAKREIGAATQEVIGNVMAKVKRGRTVLEDVEIYNRLKVVDLEPKAGDTLSGTVVNASDKKLTELKIKIIFLDSQNNTVNVQEYDNAVKNIAPNSSVKFAVNTLSVQYTKAKGMVSDFNIEGR